MRHPAGRSRRSCWRRSPATRSATGGSRRALERALDLAEPECLLFPFLLHPAPGLLERHRRHRTAHAALIAEILNLLAGQDTRRSAVRTRRGCVSR